MDYADDSGTRPSVYALIDMLGTLEYEKYKKREREYRYLLKRCHIEGICFCKQIKSLKLAVKQRKIALPKTCTKIVLAKRLQQFDSQHPFQFMDLPVEIRLRIYSMAISSHQDLTISDHRDVAEPALLQTNRQIRSESIPIFYGTNCFRLELQVPTDSTNRTLSYLFKEPELTWLHLIGPDRIKSLRHVSFYNRDSNVRLNLTSRLSSEWMISLIETNMGCPFKGHKEWTLPQMRRHFSINARLEALDPTINPVDMCSMTVTKAIQDFHASCSEGNKLETTLPGLSILAEAAISILEATLFAGGSSLVGLYGYARA
ncbi:unnamed protein product [Aureobasidium mustum]|uniref:2EXR domain-containing protein n=1 Tax=Aureobasidium mustum TaxID=2773714 RepID=A0A9N8K765_9PEZI|nr:unnamed protein product [Aureobasidium mustum]